MKLIIPSLILISSMLAVPAIAQENGTLDKVKKTGVFTLGVRESAVPFSYYDNNQKIVGYSAELSLPNLVVKQVPTTPLSRLPLISNGTVDLECGSTTNNLARQKQVSFSNTTFVIGTRLLVKKNSGIREFADLSGKNVVTTQGTTPEQILREMNSKNNMRMNIISAKDHAESFLTLETGRAAGFFIDDALLYGQLAKSPNAKDYEVVGKPQSFEAYALVLRKDDPEFRAFVNETLAPYMTSGMALELYKKWFMSPIPPNGINLNFPLSDQLREAFAKPNDQAFQ
jgi:glutamate/aspartate transport system substrate-binding protein